MDDFLTLDLFFRMQVVKKKPEYIVNGSHKQYVYSLPRWSLWMLLVFLLT